MKRILSLLLVMVMSISMMSLAAAEEDTEADVSAALVAGLSEFEFDELVQMYEFVVLYKGVADQEALFDTYWDTFVKLAADNSYNIDSDRLKEPARQMMIYLSSMDEEDLKSYMGIEVNDTDPVTYTQIDNDFVGLGDYLQEEVVDVVLLFSDYDETHVVRGIQLMTRGFRVMNKALEALKEENARVYSADTLYVLDADTFYSLGLRVNSAVVASVTASLGEALPGGVIQDSEVLSALSSLGTYYGEQLNGDKFLIFSFLYKYGYVDISEAVAIYPSSTGTVTEVNIDGTAIPLADLGDDQIPLAPFPMFSDLDDHTWAQTAIERLFQFGVVNGTVSPGYSITVQEVQVADADGLVKTKSYNVRAFNGEQGLYSPDNKVTRAQFAAIVLRLMGDEIQQSLTTAYTDLNPEAWYYDEVLTAINLGYMDGIALGEHFNPNDNITREDMAVVIGNILLDNNLVLDVADQDILTKFSDASEISESALEVVKLVVSNDIIQGTDVSGAIYFKPQDSASRAEMAVMIYRLAELITTQVYINPSEPVADVEEGSITE